MSYIRCLYYYTHWCGLWCGGLKDCKKQQHARWVVRLLYLHMEHSSCAETERRVKGLLDQHFLPWLDVERPLVLYGRQSSSVGCDVWIQVRGCKWWVFDLWASCFSFVSKSRAWDATIPSTFRFILSTQIHKLGTAVPFDGLAVSSWKLQFNLLHSLPHQTI
jgi:hypothetical protein